MKKSRSKGRVTQTPDRDRDRDDDLIQARSLWATLSSKSTVAAVIGAVTLLSAAFEFGEGHGLLQKLASGQETFLAIIGGASVVLAIELFAFRGRR